MAVEITVPTGQNIRLAGPITGPKPHVEHSTAFDINVESHEGTVVFTLPTALQSEDFGTRAANNNGGTDNITVVLVAVQAETIEAPTKTAEGTEPGNQAVGDEPDPSELDELEKKQYPGTKPGF